MPALFKAAVWGLSVYAVYCTLLFLFQRHLLYPRSMAVTLPESSLKSLPLQRQWITVGNFRCESWYVAPAGPHAGAEPVPVAVLAHGNAETIDTMVDEFLPLRKLGMGILLVEYPGYGRSGGTPSQQRIREVYTAAYDALAARPGVDDRRIVFIGRSLGGGVVCDLSRERPPAAIVLISTFTSVRSFAVRYLAPGALVRDPFDNVAALQQYSGPVLIIHGRRDNIISYRHALDLHRAVPNSRLITYPCAHNDCPPDRRQFWADLTGFLVSVLAIHHR